MTCEHEIKIVTDNDGDQWIAECDGGISNDLFKLQDSEKVKSELDYCRELVNNLQSEKYHLGKSFEKQKFHIKCWQAVSGVIVGLSLTFIFGG